MCKVVIERIRIYHGKGEAGTELDEGRLIENLGLEGDFHAADSDRQISFLFAECRELMDSSELKGLCFNRYRENISLRGGTAFQQNEASVLRPGVRLEAGEAILEITDEIKRCHEECVLHRAGEQCPLAGRNLFARVLRSGLVRVGEFLHTA